MIYITGDMHGDFGRFAKKQRSKLPFLLTGKDYVIVCGDFGLCWMDGPEFRYDCKWLGSLPFKILFVDGNHENFSMLGRYPVEEWNGGKVHHIVRDKIIHLMRGQVFMIEGKSFFTFGGASSHDIEGGILDRKDPLYNFKKKEAIQKNLPYRVLGLSWWKEELPDEGELQEGLDHLEKVGYQVDYVVSHCCSNRFQDKLKQQDTALGFWAFGYGTDLLTDYFDGLEDQLQYQQWFCGHYHVQGFVDGKHTALYESIVPVDCYLDQML